MIATKWPTTPLQWLTDVSVLKRDWNAQLHDLLYTPHAKDSADLQGNKGVLWEDRCLAQWLFQGPMGRYCHCTQLPLAFCYNTCMEHAHLAVCTTCDVRVKCTSQGSMGSYMPRSLSMTFWHANRRRKLAQGDRYSPSYRCLSADCLLSKLRRDFTGKPR